MSYLVSLGELMLRYSPPKYERLRHATSLNIRMCGAQFNLAADLALLGKTTVFLTKLPDNELGRLARSAGMAYGVDMSHVRMVPGSRIGIVYVEFGLEPRPTLHIYDRGGSAASEISKDDFDGKEILKESKLAYTDGIFLGLSPDCREAALEFTRVAKEVGSIPCFDMNYRKAIWEPAEAKEVYRQILRSVEVVVTNRTVSETVLGFYGTDEEIASEYCTAFGCQTVCMTSREMCGHSRGKWKSMAFHQGRAIHGRQFEFEVCDRFGTGDAFFAGFLYGYEDGDLQFALDFGNALCALAHTVEGDVIPASAEEVRSLLDGPGHIHIQR